MASVTLTRDLACASGQDAGNHSMRKAGRTAWNEEDRCIAVSKTNRLLLSVPFEAGGLGGVPITHSMLDDLGLTVEDARLHGANLLGDNGGPPPPDAGRLALETKKANQP